MRRRLAVGLIGVFVLGAMVSGCGKSEKAATPPLMDLPKEGPTIAGEEGKGKARGKAVNMPGNSESGQ